MKKILAFISFIFITSCAAPPVAIGLGVAAAASFGYISLNDEGPLDPLISVITKKDCNIIRMDRDRGDYCRDFDQDIKTPSSMFKNQPVWCYRELSQINCYRTPDTDITKQVVYYEDPEMIKQKMIDYWVQEKQKQIKKKERVLGKPATLKTRPFARPATKASDEKDNSKNMSKEEQEMEEILSRYENQNQNEVPAEDIQSNPNQRFETNYQNQNQDNPPLDESNLFDQNVLDYQPQVDPVDADKDKSLSEPGSWQNYGDSRRQQKSDSYYENSQPYDLAPTWFP